MNEQIELGKSTFTQLCVWPGTTMEGISIDDFEGFFLTELGTRVKFHKVILTNPDLNPDGTAVPETGGRSDLFFYVHSDDVGKFSVPRLKMGIRWWEDVIFYNNNSKHLYPEDFIENHQPTW
jgi:hypothetical protein